jgi:phage shock protein PspC (stress-responsive transcriptional regulator)
MQNRLVRPESGRVLAGVCSGLAQWVGLDVSLMRVIFIILGVLTGMGLLVYLVLWVVIPSESETSSTQKDWSSRAGQMRDEFIQATSQPNMEALRVFGAVLVIAGIFFLFKEIRPEWFFWLNKGILWSGALILIGVVLVARSMKGGQS